MTAKPIQTRMKRNHRQIIRRIIVRGNLVLQSPACLGSGDAEGLTDMVILRDSISDRALLTGASIAGALRNFLREHENGYRCIESNTDWATRLFGGIRGDEEGDQSPLIIHDALSLEEVPNIELRDGVCIDDVTGTAKPQAKYDLELLAAETQFPLEFELIVDAQEDVNQQLQALTIALHGLETGEIQLGMKKRRGCGHCQVKQWQVWNFDMSEAGERAAWLTWGRDWEDLPQKLPLEGSILHALRKSLPEDQRDRLALPEDQRDRFTLEATFVLTGAVLIRSGQANSTTAPDVVHLKNSQGKPILSGTSLAGVIRHRATRIVNTLQRSPELIVDLFGEVKESQKKAQSSRLIVQESEIGAGFQELVQYRIAIDRFTGGALHGALFDEQPLFGNSQAEFNLKLELHNPQPDEIGLLLLVLKDLWTGDLAIGSGSSIGRGRLQGKQATLKRAAQVWTIKQEGDRLSVTDPQQLEAFVQALLAPQTALPENAA